MSDRHLATNEKLRFFKALMPGFSKRLEVPPEFVKHIVNEKNDRFYLWSPLRKPWHVKVLGEIPNLYFGDGWTQFVHDHELETGCFLIFCYEGPMQFSVQIFDRSSCEKDYSHRLGKNSVQSRGDAGSNLQETFNHETRDSKFEDLKRAAQHMAHNVNLATKKRNTGLCNGEKLKGLTDDSQETDEGVCTVTEVISLKRVVEKSKESKINEKEDQRHVTIPEEDAKKTTSCKRIRTECDQNDGNSLRKSTTEGLCNGEEAEGLLTDDSGAIGKGIRTVTEVISLKGVAGKNKDSKLNRKEDQKLDTIPEEDAMNTTNHKRTRREHDQNDRNSLKKSTPEGSSNQEEHATYKVTLRPNNLRGHYYLYIPVNFKEATGISQKNKLILRDPNRKLWWVDVQHSTKNRTLLVRGWKEFCVTNMLRPGDDCEFHLTNDFLNGEKIFQVCITKNPEEYRKAAVEVQRTCGTIVSGMPWFWIKMSVNLLFGHTIMQIPNAFTARFDISQRQYVILKDHNGRQFSTSLFHSTRNRTMFRGSWREFARANSVKPDDVCEFRPDPSFSINSTFNVNVLRKSCERKVQRN